MGINALAFAALFCLTAPQVSCYGNMRPTTVTMTHPQCLAMITRSMPVHNNERAKPFVDYFCSPEVSIRASLAPARNDTTGPDVLSDRNKTVPALTNAVPGGAIVPPVLCARHNLQLSEAQSSDIMLQSTISYVFRDWNPATISGFIVTIIVKSFNPRSFWSLTHVIQEINKVKPSLTNSDSSASIILVRWIIGVEASLFHRLPRAIRGTLNRSRMSMLFHIRLQESY